ncbi:MAG: hypothetical protein B6I20_04760 [Bacteroidetes bacterium 4572_117]|nr:MAG: hypothetical protein B6I20_04760 [Bacteroidetes bacterium 4572_117]
MDKILFIFSLVLMSINSLAQEFDWEAKLDKVTKDAYYKINISPGIVSASENNNADIRLYDASNNEIPYIVEKEQMVNRKEFFVEYKIIKNESLRKWPYYSRIVVHNPDKDEISNFQLVIRNADVTKSLKLSGSDDGKHWYVIKDKYRFRSIYSDESVSVIKILNFPKSNYEYFEILIDDWRNNPINIQNAGYFDMTLEEGKYARISGHEIMQTELKKEKQSLLEINFPSAQLVNKIQLKIDGPEFYHREAEILVKDSTVYKKKDTEYFFTPIHSFIISSNSLNNVYFNDFRIKEFFIRINNYDNQPIKITSVNIWQLKHYLVASLKKDESYFIRTGNSDLVQPEYDLKYFKGEIPKKLNQVSAKKIVNISEKKEIGQKGLQVNKIVIWLVIGGIAILLIYFTTKMMKDMGNSPKI